MKCLIFLLVTLKQVYLLRLGSINSQRYFKVENSLRNIDLSLKATSKDFLQEGGNPCRIKVVGVGGGGGNAVNRMLESSLGVSGVDFWVVNTDMQALTRSLVPNKLNIGSSTSRLVDSIHIMVVNTLFNIIISLSTTMEQRTRSWRKSRSRSTGWT